MIEGLIIDCFAGGGGASQGIEEAIGRPIDIAVNHDPEAIRMHKVNHPNTLHLTEDIFEVDLQAYVMGRHVGLMWASPDCTSHSKAKGGQPRLNGLRILPWAVHKHARVLLPDVIIMENVEEIQEWGPLDENGRPIKSRAGENYEQFMDAMRGLGYKAETCELVAADYGAPTTRRRWYAVFRHDGKSIKWPEKTHSKTGEQGKKKWLKCGDYIDFKDLGKSIFGREKPLAEATMKRIAGGFRKYVVESPEPYIVPDKDAAAFLIQYHGEQKSGEVRGQSLAEPIMTLDTSNRYGLVTAFITKFYKTGIGQSLAEPLHTITTSPGHFGLVTAWLIKYYGAGTSCQGCDEPLATITTKDRFGLASALIERDGETYMLKDIFLRMLKPEPELKLLQGFPEDYVITHDYEGKPYPIKEQVAKIGNSVVPIMARAIVEANIA